MSAMLDSLLDAERLADCIRHDEEDQAEEKAKEQPQEQSE